jgi:hypothetical protein
MGKTPQQWQQEMFEDTDRFLETVKRIERIRQRLSPLTKVFISEFGIRWQQEDVNTFAPLRGGKSSSEDPKIPDVYWTLGASVFAYGYLGAIREGVDLVAAAELVNYPGQLAGTNLIHWNTGEPNAVYRVVKMLHDEVRPGAKLVQTAVKGDGLAAQAFQTLHGRSKLLLINKTSESLRVRIKGMASADARSADAITDSSKPRRADLNGDEVMLRPHAVTIVIGATTPKMVEKVRSQSR